jgi:hypothetical protein
MVPQRRGRFFEPSRITNTDNEKRRPSGRRFCCAGTCAGGASSGIVKPPAVSGFGAPGARGFFCFFIFATPFHRYHRR